MLEMTEWCSVDFQRLAHLVSVEGCLHVSYFSLEVVDLDIGTLDSFVDE